MSVENRKKGGTIGCFTATTTGWLSERCLLLPPLGRLFARSPDLVAQGIPITPSGISKGETATPLVPVNVLCERG